MKHGAITLSLACLILTGCMKEDTEENFARGMEMLYNGSYEDAENHFLTLSRRIEKNEKNGKNGERIWQAKSLYEVGRIEHLYLNQPQRAVARLREAVKIFPEANFAFKAQKEIAFIFYDRLRDYRTAALEFERLVNAFPDRDDIWKYQYRIAQSYFMIREFDQARAEVRLLLEKHKKGRIAAEAMLLVANSYYVQGRYREAAEAHQALLNIRPSEQIEARSLFEMGMCYQELGDYALAEKSYLAALKKHPRPDLVKIQLTSLQKQMIEEQGEKKEESPFSHGVKKITNPKKDSKTVTKVKNTKENRNKDVETKKIEDDRVKTEKKQSPEPPKDKPDPEKDKPSSVPVPKAPDQKETKKS
ncbi:MAG TPA: tetratricopeptide repeat protein [Myxococcota bacterium]|nr:tetratricopeptide repeat protein [Myxococcota bacterium]